MTNLNDTHKFAYLGIDALGDIQYYMTLEHGAAENATQLVPCLIRNEDFEALSRRGLDAAQAIPPSAI